MGADPIDPRFASSGEPMIFGHEPAGGHEDPQVGAFVEVVAGPGDAQEEGARLMLHGAAVGLHADEFDGAVGLHLPDARPRRGGNELDVLRCVLDHHLTP